VAQGVVKWWNAQKGYGFIAVHGGADIFVHFTAIATEGLELQVGQIVEFEITQGAKGPQAHRVKASTGPADRPIDGLDRPPGPELDDSEW